VSVLVVEDEVRIAAFLVDGLRARGHEVDHASTGSEALERAPAAELVLLDLGLPDLDGWEVLRRLRQSDDRLPVIILTARNDLRDRQLGVELGADAYLTKPFGLDELAELIDGALVSN
jgi:DNA-binding response OmpR family regulator